MIPFILLGGILTGWFTPTEAGVVAVFWILVVVIPLLNRGHIRLLPYDFCIAGLIFSLPLITIGAANAFGWMLAYLRGAIVIADWITGIAGNDPHLIMLMMVLLFTIIGDFIEPVPTIIIFMPLVNALTQAGNINPVHMGVVLIATLAFGLITPPYGLVLLMASKFVGVRLLAGAARGAADLRRLPRHDRLRDLLPQGRAVAAQAGHPRIGRLLQESERLAGTSARLEPASTAMHAFADLPVAPFAVRPLTPKLGAEISGLDLAGGLAPEVFRALYDAFLRIPGAGLSAGAICRRRRRSPSARQFGEVQVHVMAMYHADGFPELYRLSNLDADGRPNGKHPDKGTLVWHTDGSWRRVTGQATIIYGEIVPESGGETHFCDMYGAYERLERRLEAAHRRHARRPQPRLLAHPPPRRRPDDRGAEARGATGRAPDRSPSSRDRPHLPLPRRSRRIDRRPAVRRRPSPDRRAQRARRPRRPELRSTAGGRTS